MSGLLIFAFYGMFWWLCWKFAGLFSQSNSVAVKVRTWVVFLIIAAAPYYVYRYEKSIYDQICEDVEVFFPDEKIDGEKVLIFYVNRWANILVKPDGPIDYTISPASVYGTDIDGYVRLKRETLNGNSSNLLVVHDKYNARISQNDYLYNETIRSSRYGYFYVQSEEVIIENMLVIGISDYFIYDFQLQQKISNIGSASKIRNERIFFANYLLPYQLRSCESTIGISELFEKTFNKWRDEKNGFIKME